MGGENQRCTNCNCGPEEQDHSAPEPEVPEEVKDLCLTGSPTTMSAGRLERLLIEAFRRGQKSQARQ